MTPHNTVDRAGGQWAGNIFYAKIISQIQGEAWDMPGVKMTWFEGVWRRDGDSNPGGAFTPTRFPGVRLKPLGHPSFMNGLAAAVDVQCGAT